MIPWRRGGWTLGGAMSRRLDRGMVRRAQEILRPVLEEGEEVLAYDPATTASTAPSPPVVTEGVLVNIYLTDRAIYVVEHEGATTRIARTDFEVNKSTSAERIDLDLNGGRRLAAIPTPAPSRIAAVLADLLDLDG
ncbi:MAG: hypothetical protein ACR2H3_11905 [Acidimicrobiales bacterium]